MSVSACDVVNTTTAETVNTRLSVHGPVVPAGPAVADFYETTEGTTLTVAAAGVLSNDRGTGLQDHEHWRGPSNGPLRRVSEQDWFATGGGDGIYTVVDPTDSRWLYTTREYGSHFRVDQKFGIRTDIMPRASAGQPPYRFLWEPPVSISPHNPQTIYAGAQMLLKSSDRGDHWTEISPDLSSHPADKIFPESEGGVPGGIPWFAITSISESPMTKGLIWAGTSDGKVQVTRDDLECHLPYSPRLIVDEQFEVRCFAPVRCGSHAMDFRQIAGRAEQTKFDIAGEPFMPPARRGTMFLQASIRSFLPKLH